MPRGPFDPEPQGYWDSVDAAAEDSGDYPPLRVKRWDGPWRLSGPWWVRRWRWSDDPPHYPSKWQAVFMGGEGLMRRAQHSGSREADDAR